MDVHVSNVFPSLNGGILTAIFMATIACTRSSSIVCGISCDHNISFALSPCYVHEISDEVSSLVRLLPGAVDLVSVVSFGEV